MNNNDIQMTEGGDLALTDGDVFVTDSIKQAILIKLRWILGEWKFGPQFGVDYWNEVLVKKPNALHIQGIIRSEVMSVDGVKEVQDISLVISRRDRIGNLTFTAVVEDRDRYDREVEYWDHVRRGTDIIYTEEDGELVAMTRDGIKKGVFTIEDGDLILRENKALQMAVTFSLDGDLFATYL